MLELSMSTYYEHSHGYELKSTCKVIFRVVMIAHVCTNPIGNVPRLMLKEMAVTTVKK